MLLNKLKMKRGNNQSPGVQAVTLSMRDCERPLHEQVDVFETSLGSQVPVYADYRYAKKPVWLNYSGLSVLAELDKAGSLDDAGREHLIRLRGTRTLMAPISEIQEIVQPYVDQHRDLFLHQRVPRLGKRVLMPTFDQMRAGVDAQRKKISSYLDHAVREGYGVCRPGARALEIGYISGGESLVALEELGFAPSGIDYFYDGQFDGVQRWELIRDLSKTKVTFHQGDVTKRTEFPDGEFDLVYTESTIEHIQNLPDAFAELHRLLKPGGLMIHAYDPFFYPLGGHSFGMLDAPWAHMRMPQADLYRYLDEFRPHEADESRQFIEGSLNPTYTQAFVQQSLVKAGFRISWWYRSYIDRSEMASLTPDVLGDINKNYPALSLDDLTVNSVIFMAERI